MDPDVLVMVDSKDDVMSKVRCGTRPPGFSVHWPVDDPAAPASAAPVVVPYGRINGFPVLVHIWRDDRPPDADARYVPEIRGWIAVRVV